MLCMSVAFTPAWCWWCSTFLVENVCILRNTLRWIPRRVSRFQSQNRIVKNKGTKESSQWCQCAKKRQQVGTQRTLQGQKFDYLRRLWLWGLWWFPTAPSGIQKHVNQHSLFKISNRRRFGDGPSVAKKSADTLLKSSSCHQFCWHSFFQSRRLLEAWSPTWC